MKKTLSLFLVFVMLLGLCACGNDQKADTTNPGATEVTQESTEETTEFAQATDVEETTGFTEDPATTPSEENNTKPTEKPIEPTKPVHTHSYSAATCTQPKKCSCGATSGSALGHKWTNATCTTAKTCSVCKVTEGSAAGHKWTAATCTTPKTCTVCKTTEGTAADHKWADATCQAPKTCSVCKKTEGVSVDHSFESSGKCKWCKQILPVDPANIKNREYVIYESSTGMLKCYSLHFGLNGASDGEYLTCEEVFGGTCQTSEGHFRYGGRDYHCVSGSGLCAFTSQKSGNHIVVSNIEESNVVLTIEVLSNDTLRVVSISGQPPVQLSVGDIFV